MFKSKITRLLLVLLAAFLFASSCKKKPKAADVGSVEGTFLDDGQDVIQNSQEQNPAEITNQNTPEQPVQDAQVGDTPSDAAQTLNNDQIEIDLEVSNIIEYYFPSIAGARNLYAAVEVKNNSNKPVCVSNIHVSFKTEENIVETSFTPLQNNDDFIEVGETSSFAVWTVFDREEKLNSESKIEVTASAKGKARDESRLNRKLAVTNLMLVKNYPDFATLTGTFTSPSLDQNYSLALIYASFYDSQDNLLGVWHFTKNMPISGESKNNFAIYLNELPILDLSENTARIEARGVGID